MSQVLTVPTHFTDLGELSEGFLDRVEQDTLILYGPVAYEEGSPIDFAVLLGDGTPALEGTGVVRAAVDGGEDRVPETRYDVVVESLDFEGRYEVIFERLVLDRQAVSDHPAAEEAVPITGDVDVVPADGVAFDQISTEDDEPGVELVTSDAPVIEAAEVGADEVFSLSPDELLSVAPEEEEGAPETVPPEALEDVPETVPPEEDQEDELDDAPETVPPEALADAPETVPPIEDDAGDAPETVPPDAFDDEAEDEAPPTVVAAVDAEAMMAEALAEAATHSEPAGEPEVEVDATDEDIDHADHEEHILADPGEPLRGHGASRSEPVSDADPATDPDPSEAETVSGHAFPYEDEVAAEASSSEASFDSEYAFEHGIAQEPKVGMPVPIPSMAAPPEAPPAPPTLRLAEPPDGLTRPSLAQPEDSLFLVDDEVSDVHTTGLFAHEDGLPIPSSPPFPDPNRAKQVAPVEAANDFDVEDSEPPELLTDDYEEVRLSDFAEAADEG